MRRAPASGRISRALPHAHGGRSAHFVLSEFLCEFPVSSCVHASGSRVGPRARPHAPLAHNGVCCVCCLNTVAYPQPHTSNAQISFRITFLVWSSMSLVRVIHACKRFYLLIFVSPDSHLRRGEYTVYTDVGYLVLTCDCSDLH